MKINSKPASSFKTSAKKIPKSVFYKTRPYFSRKKKTFLNYNHDDLNTMNLFEEPIFNSSTLKNDEDIAKTIFEIFFFF